MCGFLLPNSLLRMLDHVNDALEKDETLVKVLYHSHVLLKPVSHLSSQSQLKAFVTRDWYQPLLKPLDMSTQ